MKNELQTRGPKGVGPTAKTGEKQVKQMRMSLAGSINHSNAKIS